MPQRDDLEPHFAGTYHVTADITEMFADDIPWLAGHGVNGPTLIARRDFEDNT